jgi:hypothetical protein
VRKREDTEQEVFEILHAARAAIRLKYSIRALREINDKLPAIEDAAFEAISNERIYELDTDSLLKDDEPKYVEPLERFAVIDNVPGKVAK